MGKKQSITSKMSLNSITSLKTQITTSFLMIGIIPLLVFSIVSGLVLKSSMYKSELKSLRQLSSLVTENLDNWGDENLILAQDIANSPIILDGNLESIKAELKNKKGQNINIQNILYIYTIFAVAKLTSMGKSKKSAIAQHSFNTFPLSLTNEKPKMEGTI